MNKVSTHDLIKLIKTNKGKIFEVALSNGVLRATHLIYWGGKLLYDTGIDSQEIKWKTEEFLYHYSKSYWIIDQVV